MKALDEALGGTAVRTILLPGSVGAATAHAIFLPFLRRLRDVLQLELSIVFLAEVILIGLILTSAARPVYWIYEGFKWKWLTIWARNRNTRLVNRWQRELVTVYAGRSGREFTEEEEDRVRVLHEKLCDYPMANPDGDYYWYVERPTRLGNIIATYELYPELKYGIDGRTYWYHLLNLAPPHVRKEFDEQQSFARSLVLTSFAGGCTAVIGAWSLVALLTGKWIAQLALFEVGIGIQGAIVLACSGMLVWASFYFLSFAAHRDAGELFRAIIDDVHDKFSRTRG